MLADLFVAMLSLFRAILFPMSRFWFRRRNTQHAGGSSWVPERPLSHCVDKCMYCHFVSSRDDQFRPEVRARDGRCVKTGRVNNSARWGNWIPYEAAHVHLHLSFFLLCYC
ncbi:conserved hypothetical protein [Histoplasma capsulatum G186AR]|uniref:Uncharacterized protein n=1 Tax=Ajellomyces capsulatus (strain G186AR / H82 / ATCC MYA-2454 / RMSCC 2432) TaxID=447093 RepID=C0NGI5_AJECG|nr:uncharacterized protein HCBG_02457 [Histoplasma capsulatum G186AR]EEH08920.1 conserved hypothetical protein [Histoplasma capsulatum G186AR]